ncbi:hypothetical protein OH146_00005 [Salinibacterium sp. SYSU T00001]|uniref:hypothetical protein n=1 Tax=Homoserinimonas sedimenticola TaxID=2986805 RepID=UPI0022367F14|nr:hypothetical protein [Salinibacterium sedimenticola]MCW4384153.1 hypothetical protein [Salinibacterium sedimenticola]
MPAAHRLGVIWITVDVISALAPLTARLALPSRVALATLASASRPVLTSGRLATPRLTLGRPATVTAGPVAALTRAAVPV